MLLIPNYIGKRFKTALLCYCSTGSAFGTIRQVNILEFNGIETVVLTDRDVAVRTEIVEEFDPVMTNFLTEQDGWQHYETKTVEYEVPDGYEYTFLIYNKNGRKEMRVYHESSPIADMLIEISEGW